MQRYHQTMNYQTAAVMVLDHLPSEDELEEIAYTHLESFDREHAVASIDVTDKAPTFLNVCEQDQVNAYLRDGRPYAVCVTVYMREGELEDDDPDGTFEVSSEWEDDSDS